MKSQGANYASKLREVLTHISSRQEKHTLNQKTNFKMIVEPNKVIEIYRLVVLQKKNKKTSDEWTRTTDLEVMSLTN